jgi:hypothetical protein
MKRPHNAAFFIIFLSDHQEYMDALKEKNLQAVDELNA